MGCACSGGKGGTTIAATSAARRSAAAMPPGFDESQPVLIGDVDDVTRRVRVIHPVEGMSIGASVWVTGSGVQQHLDSGALLDITHTAQRRRLFRVGAFTYTSFQEANRVAAATGQTVIEVA